MLSEQQLSYAVASSPRPPIIAFDGDEPGRESNRRLAHAARAINQTVTIAHLPAGEDPASLIATRGVEALRSLMPRDPQPPIDSNGSTQLKGAPEDVPTVQESVLSL